MTVLILPSQVIIGGDCCSQLHSKSILPVKERKFLLGTGLYHTQYQVTWKYGEKKGRLFPDNLLKEASGFCLLFLDNR